MKKYQVVGLIDASVQLGEYEANSQEEAIRKAEFDQTANWHPTLCQQCSKDIDISDIYDVRAYDL